MLLATMAAAVDWEATVERPAKRILRPLAAAAVSVRRLSVETAEQTGGMAVSADSSRPRPVVALEVLVQMEMAARAVPLAAAAVELRMARLATALPAVAADWAAALEALDLRAEQEASQVVEAVEPNFRMAETGDLAEEEAAVEKTDSAGLVGSVAEPGCLGVEDSAVGAAPAERVVEAWGRAARCSFKKGQTLRSITQILPGVR